jgi:hypothetical protein
MKKITLQLLLLVFTGYVAGAQNLLSNGDFEDGMVTWFGNAFNVVEDGGNSFNQSDNEVSTNAFDVNLSHPVELMGGTTYIFSFDAATSAEDVTRTIIAGIGLNEGGFEAAVETVTVTADLQNYSLTLTPPIGSANSRALFDLGADDGLLIIDNVVLTVQDNGGGQDGELLSNGDFEQGMVTWFGNAFNVQTDGGNSFNQSDNEISTNAFDVNLSHPVELVGGTEYVLSFDASTSAEDVSRTIIAGIGLNEGGFEAAVQTVTVTADLQNYSFNLTPPLGSTNSRALFDLGADDGLLILDNVSLTLANSGGGNEVSLPVDFELPAATYTFGGFEGADSAIEANPDPSGENTTANVMRTTKTNGAQFFAGTSLDLDTPIDFSMMTGITMQTWSPKANIPVRLALENQTTGNQVFVDVNTTATDSWETLTYDFTGVINPAIQYNRIVVFFEFVVDLPGDGSTYYFDTLGQVDLGNAGGDVPMVAAPTPPDRAAEDVFSIYSDAYTDVPNVVFGAFNVGTQDITEIMIEGDNTQQVVLTQPDPGFLLIDWGGPLDASTMTNFHFDYWIATDLSTGLIANPKWSNHVGDAGETSAFELTNPVNTFGEWVSVDVPISDFIAGDTSQQRNALRQFVLTVVGADTGSRTVFIDNLYLYKESTGGGDVVALPVDFELPVATYTFGGFEGADSAIEANPDATGENVTANVMRTTKTTGAQFFAGTSLDLDTPIDFSMGTVLTMQTWSPKAAIPVRMALENQDTGNQIFVDVNTTTTNAWETLTYDFAGLIDPAINYNRVVVFFEFIVDLAGDGSTYYFDTIELAGGNGGGDMPLTAAPTPPDREAEDVFSIYSDAYTDVPNVVFGAFGVGTQDITELAITGDNLQQIVLTQPDPGFLLVDWGGPLDASAMTNFHMDYWIATDLATGLIANPKWSNHVGDAGETSAFELTNAVNTFGEWVSIDVPIADFIAGDTSQQRDALRQFVLTVVGADAGERTIFIDNLYLYKEPGGGDETIELPVDFELAASEYTFVGFEGADSAIEANPDTTGENMTATAMRTTKTVGAQFFAGTFLDLDVPIDFSMMTGISIQTWSPKVDIPVRVALENQMTGNQIALDVNTTVGSAWETLTYDFTDLIDPNVEYDRVVVFFEFVDGLAGDGTTYFFDTIQLAEGNGGGGGDPYGLPVDFEDDAAFMYDIEAFGGAVSSLLANPDATGENTSATVVQSLKTDGAEVFAGTILDLDIPIDFSTLTGVSMQTWSPKADVTIRMALENQSTGNQIFVDATNTVTSEWETLTFDFTSAIDPAIMYDRVVVFFDFDVVGDDTTYFYDTIQLAEVDGGDPVGLPVDFEDNANLMYDFVGFEGAASSLIANPDASGDNTSATVIQTIKTEGAQFFAGTFLDLDIPIDFSSLTNISVGTWSPKVDIPVRIALENQAAGGGSQIFVDVNTTVGSTWETLTADFTDLINPAVSYDRVIIFFEFIDGLAGDGTTYFFDNIELSEPLSVDDFSTVSVSAFPNPSSDQWSVRTSSQVITSLDVFDVLGRKVISQETNSNEVTIDATNLPKGMFIATITTAEGVKSIKLIKN